MQILLLQTYCGCSNFRSWWECNGRELDRQEDVKRGLWSEELSRQHKRSSYAYEWFEIVPGTIISVEIDDDYVDQPIVEKITFVMGAELPNPPNNPWQLYTYETTRDYLFVHATSYIREPL